MLSGDVAREPQDDLRPTHGVRHEALADRMKASRRKEVLLQGQDGDRLEPRLRPPRQSSEDVLAILLDRRVHLANC
jgi:hypothetical protein